MALIQRFANQAQTTLAGAITSTALTANLAPGSGVLFPALGSNEYFVMILNDSATNLNYEEVWVTAISGDTITMLRGQEGSAAKNWFAGDIAFNGWTAGSAAKLAQSQQVQGNSFNYGADAGTANSYAVALTPALTAQTDGMVIWFKALNANTGASTIAIDGLTSVPLIGAGGAALQGGEIVANGRCQAIYDATRGSYALVECIGAPIQVAPGTQTGHAITLGQAVGRVVRTTIYMLISGTLKVSVDGGSFVTAVSTFTKHPLSSIAEIRLIGGGGAGGGTTSGPAGYTAASAGGAEGGGCWTILNASAINGVAVTVGAGGIASSGANGGNGGTTSLGSILSATGGAGANVQPAVPGSTNTFSGLSLGGQGVGGLINYTGGMGKSAFLSQNGSVSGEGGGSQLGAGGALVSGTAGGTAATNPGTGGSGGCVSDAGINSSGGNGASGVIIIIERTA